MNKIKDVEYVPLDNDSICRINELIQEGYTFTGHTEGVFTAVHFQGSVDSSSEISSRTYAILILWEDAEEEERLEKLMAANKRMDAASKRISEDEE